MSLNPVIGDAPPSAANLEQDPAFRRVDRLVEQAALIMMPMGFLLILLGWSGASRTPLLFEQIPYLISGGLLGLGLMLGGGLLYVGGWVARAAHMAAAQYAAPPAVATAAVAAPTAARRAPSNRPGGVAAFVRTPSGSMFHRRDCAIVSSRDDVVQVSRDDAAGFKACGMCDPLAV